MSEIVEPCVWENLGREDGGIVAEVVYRCPSCGNTIGDLVHAERYGGGYFNPSYTASLLCLACKELVRVVLE